MLKSPFLVVALVVDLTIQLLGTPARAEAWEAPFQGPASQGKLVLSGQATQGVDWSSLLDPAQTGDILFGVVLKGPSPFEKDADRPFAPASTSKLFTSALALDRLGADYQFSTWLNWRVSRSTGSAVALDLEILGSGDPSWGLREVESEPFARIDSLVRALQDAGIQEIRGPIQVRSRDPRLDTTEAPGSWDPADLTHCYGTAPQGFSVAENCSTLRVSSPTRAEFEEPGIPTPVELKIQNGDRTELELEWVQVRGKPQRLRVKGTWHAGDSKASIDVPVLDARSWVRNLFLLSASRQGIRLGLVAAPESRTDDENRSLELRSPPLRAILPGQNKRSVNGVAESLLRTVGSSLSIDPTEPLLAASRRALRGYLDNLGEGARAAQLLDGSGLSRGSRTTASAQLELLEHARQAPWFEALRDSLPVAGRDGTLGSRMKGTAAEGHLQAKTGTLRGFYQLAGFADGVPFVILTQAPPELRPQAHAAQDRVGAKLCELLQESASPRP